MKNVKTSPGVYFLSAFCCSSSAGHFSLGLLLVSSDPVIMKLISSVSEVIDKVETRWPWYFGGDNEKEKLVDMDLNPVLLVPGFLGSVLHAVKSEHRFEGACLDALVQRRT